VSDGRERDGGLGDDRALQELIDRHHGRLVGLLRLRGCSPEEADDLAQETMLRLVTHWTSGPPVRNWWAWMVTVAINLQTSHWRRLAMMARRATLVEVQSEHHDPGTLEALDLLRDLPDRQRTALILRYYAGLSVRETAKAMGVAEGTVKSLASAGRTAARNGVLEAEVMT
jgi:RNA polymerase sigma-70 factor (ECF subfamily)